MLETLEDAWRWYQDTRTLLKLQRRLATHWDGLPWDGPLGRDHYFENYSGTDLQSKGDFTLSHLDDLAIVVLFSVFESLVREYVLREVIQEETTIQHRAIKLAVTQVKERIERGGFFHVLEPFKDEHHDLVELVHQVREYRNWVAHGRRGAPTNNVDPTIAYHRLRKFLEILDGSAENSAPG